MDWKLLQGLPLSPTMAAPKAPVPSSTGIRAPLTLDDSDFEYSASTSGKKGGSFSSSSSDSEFLSDGFVSGEDEFEIGSRRPFVSGSDIGILEEAHSVKEYVLNRPLVRNPNDEFAQESSSITAFDDSRLLLLDPNEEVVVDSDDLEDCRDRLEAAIEYGTPGEGDGRNGFGTESRVLNIGTEAWPMQGMPTAQLSWDSDDDLVGSEICEEESFSSIVRVPDSGFQERSGNAPKVRFLDFGEVEDSASQTEYLSEVEILEESIAEGADDGFTNSTSEENHLFVGEQVPDSTLLAAIEDKDLIITEQVEHGDLEEGIKEPDLSNLIVEETKSANVLGDSGSQGVQHISSCEATDAEAIKVQAVESIELAVMDTGSQRNQNLGAEGTVTYGLNIEKMIDEIEQNKVEAHDLNASNNIEYVDDAAVLDTVESIRDAEAELSETEVARRSKCFKDLHFSVTTASLIVRDELHGESNVSQALHQCANSQPETSSAVNNELLTAEEGGLLQFDATQSLNFGGSEGVNTTEQLEELVSSASLSCGEGSQSHSQVIDVVTGADSKNEPNTNVSLQEEEVIDSSLAAPQRPSTGVGLEDSSVTFTSTDGIRDISLAQLASLGSTVCSLGRTKLNSAILIGPPENMAGGEMNEALSEEEKKKLEKLQQIRVKFLRLVNRLKLSPEDSIDANVLSQLLVALGRSSAQEFSFDFVEETATDLEADGNKKLDFSLNILVIGKSGVGKSATINSIFGENKAATNAFEPGTSDLREIQGTLDGIPVRVLDTPGLQSSVMEQSTNRKILLSIKKFMKRCTPDIVLYVDRLDLQTGDLNDLPLLNSITSYLGSSIWLRTILTLTHAASAPPEGPSGQVLSYELFANQRSHAVRQLISHSVGDPHIMKSSLLPVSLVENCCIFEVQESNHILPSYVDSWRSKLMCLCYSVKILCEINSTVQSKGTLQPRKSFGSGVPFLPRPHFLSSLLQSSPHPKLSITQVRTLTLILSWHIYLIAMKKVKVNITCFQHPGL